MKNLKMKKEFKVIADLLPNNSRVLDIGCGDGSLMHLLKKEKNIEVRGLELNQDNVKECIYKISNEKLPFIFKSNCIVTPFNSQDNSVISWLKFNGTILSFKSYLHSFEDYKLVYLIQNK